MYEFIFEGNEISTFFTFVERRIKGKKYCFGLVPNDEEIEDYSKFVKIVKASGFTRKFKIFPIDFQDKEFKNVNISNTRIVFKFPNEEEAFYFKLKYER